MNTCAHEAAATPLVSVLIPAFNHERFVERCLDSVLEDPYPAKEIVVIDDGSSDATAARVLAWIGRHGGELPVRFRRRGNRGVAATLNELTTLARGEFLRLAASDDYLLPGGLEPQVRHLLAHAGKAAVIGDCIVVDGDGRLLHASGMEGLHRVDKRQYGSDPGIRRAVIAHWAVSGAVVLLRRSALQRIGGWTEGLHIEDWDLFLRLAAADALSFVDVRVCAYRVHGANLSRTRERERRLRHLEESRRVAEGRSALFDEADRRLLRAQVHYIAAKVAFLRRRPLSVAWQLVLWLSLRGVAALRRPSLPSITARHA